MQSEGAYTDGTGTHAAGRTLWYVYDGLGSVVGEVDPSGNLTSSGTFDVYGAKRAGGSTGTATTRQGFVGQCGHVSDSETGLIYMRARYYDPGVGRFISEDSSENGVNWFAYADDNPTNRVDYDGKKSQWPLDFTQTCGLAAFIIATALWIWTNDAIKRVEAERAAGLQALELGLVRLSVILGPAQFCIYMTSLGGLSMYNEAVLGKYTATILAYTCQIAILLGEIDAAFDMTTGDAGLDKLMGLPNQ